MKVSIEKIIVILLACIIISVSDDTKVFADTLEFDVQTDVPVDKVWQITFSSFVSKESLHNKIFVTDEDGNTYNPNYVVEKDGTTVSVLPPNDQYDAGKMYTLNVSSDTKSVYDEILEQDATMTFMTSEPSYANIVVNKNVLDVSSIELASGEVYIPFGEPEQQAETFIVPKNIYSIGDIIKMEPNDEFTSGFMRKIVSIEEHNGQVHAKTIFPTLDEVFSELDMNTTFALTSDRLVKMELEDRVVLASNDISQGWEFGLIDYLSTIEGQAYGVTGSIKLDALSFTMDFDKRKITTGPHQFKIDAIVTSSLSIEPQVKLPLQKLYKQLLPKDEINLGTFTYVLPYGFTVQLHAGVTVRPSIMVGGTMAYTNTTEFTLGALYENKNFKGIKKFDNRNDFAKTIVGGGKVEVGPRFTVEAGFLTLGIANMHNDFGAYAKIEQHYDIEDNLGACLVREAGVFYKMSLEIPPLKKFKVSSFPLAGTELPLITKNECQLVEKIAFTNQTLTATSDEVEQVQVKVNWKDVVTAQTSKMDITELVEYTTSDDRIRVSKTGKVSVEEAAQPYTATITAMYQYNNKTYTALINVKVEPEVVTASDFIEYLKSDGVPKGYSVIEVNEYALTGQKTKEIIALFYNEYEEQTLVQAYSYDTNTAQWQPTYSTYLSGNAKFYDSGSVMNNVREQVIIGVNPGQSASFILLGSKDGKSIQMLIDESSSYYYHGYPQIKNNTVRVCESSQGKQFTWNGSSFKKEDVLCNPEASEIKPDDIVIRYSIDEDGNITSNYPNEHVFLINDVQKIHFIRENIGMIERILTYDYGAYQIIPDLYNFEQAYIYYIEYIH
ncbi:Ig-like domain-containing protein [Caryophanon latum]|uniref:SbsA Ig-like domain-containing protein n=1 Tax=Caryophanon latum TaxID=33977 RepID=A0A1C0YJE4_9BACL|nr:Ig-like domain-containing protein [Caryophanon latum]OCS87307.1 hypothetical protein A6K76_02755 [Caryophanon latum]